MIVKERLIQFGAARQVSASGACALSGIRPGSPGEVRLALTGMGADVDEA